MVQLKTGLEEQPISKPRNSKDDTLCYKHLPCSFSEVHLPIFEGGRRSESWKESGMGCRLGSGQRGSKAVPVLGGVSVTPEGRGPFATSPLWDGPCSRRNWKAGPVAIRGFIFEELSDGFPKSRHHFMFVYPFSIKSLKDIFLRKGRKKTREASPDLKGKCSCWGRENDYLTENRLS